MQGWFDKVEFLLHIDQIICQNNHQNTVFVSGALYDELIIRNTQIFEKMSYDELIIRNTQIFEKMRGEVHVLQRGSTVQ